jgi:pyruvate/2-oxoglutarate dehydrogenase complex dihydrolipoamide acyltransferase (E2) component
MPHEITMPQLGMAQDTGVIIAWHKQPGDAVKADDILMEVETDKATMEVEAGREGFLAEIRAEAGVPVPVGGVVAVLSDNAKEVKAALPPRAEKGEAKTALEPSPAAAEAEPEINARVQPPSTAPRPAAALRADRHILASPKARYEAYRRGIDLGRLVSQGLPQPFHLADLDRLTPVAETVGATSLLEARARRAAFDEFAIWASEETSGVVGRAKIWTAFATGAWRQALDDGDGRAIIVELRAALTGTAETSADADLIGLGAIAGASDEAAPDLVVHDFTGTALTAYRPVAPAVPCLVISEDADRYALALSFFNAAFPPDRAASFLESLAARTAEPLRNLL